MASRRVGSVLLTCLAAWLVWPEAALAHVGAPYPVLLEELVGPYTVSALADPDVGKGTFYVMVEAEAGGPAPAGTRVTVWTQPEDGHVVEAAYQAERQETRYGERFVAQVPFDARGSWSVRLVVEGPDGQGETGFPVEVTPAGLGWRATLGCLVPFVLVAFFWLRGVRRQRAARLRHPPGQGPDAVIEEGERADDESTP